MKAYAPSDCAIASLYRMQVNAVADARALNESDLAKAKALYDTYFDTPEHLRANLPEAYPEAVRRLEQAGADLSALREKIIPARAEALRNKMESFGLLHRVRETPAWASLLSDLEVLREWRRDHLDGIDSRMTPLFMRGPLGRNPEKGMFDDVVIAWCKAAHVKPLAVQAVIVDLANAGVLPGVMEHFGTYTAEQVHSRMADLLERHPTILYDIQEARELIPEQISDEAVEALAGCLASGPWPSA